jgi:hypothetical protein
MGFEPLEKTRFVRPFMLFFLLGLTLSLFSPSYPSSDSLLQPVLFPGWPKFFPWPHLSSPTWSVALTDLDTLPDLEIVGGFPEDSLFVWKYDGTNLDNWPVMAGIDSGVWQVTPAIGDLDGDGQLDVIATKWQGGIQNEYPCALFVFRKDGSLMPGFPVGFKGLKATAPALYDLNGDGKLEIVVSGQTYYQTDTLVYVFNYKGEILPGWPQRVANLPYEYIAGAPAVGDMDGDGKPEIVATGSQCIYAWHVDGTPVKGWPVKAEPGFYFGWIHHVVLSDLDNDGYLEVLACAFHEYPEFNGYVAVWRSDGTYMPGFPKYYQHQPNSTPIPGDIDNDGNKEIVFVTGEIVSGLPNIHVLKIDGTEEPGWPVYYFGLNEQDLMLADIDGDNSTDIIVRDNSQREGKYGRIYAYHKDGNLIPGFPMELLGFTGSLVFPNSGDVNEDGLLDMAILTQYGYGPGYNMDYYLYLFNMNVPYHPEKTLWGKLYHDNYNTNNTEFGVKRKIGDLNNSSIVDIVDVIFLLNYLFKNGKKPAHLVQADVNCDSRVDVSDLIYLYNYLFRNGKPLCSP